MNNQKGFTILGLTVFILWIVGVVGWVWNIVKLVDSFTTIAAITGMEIIRIIGIFLAPLGVIMGYL